MRLLIIKFSASSPHLLSLKSKYYPQYFLFSLALLFSSRSLGDYRFLCEEDSAPHTSFIHFPVVPNWNIGPLSGFL
jgi:hypothetical protein